MDGSRLFLVRIGGGEDGRFHAIARPVEHERAQQFDEPLALLAFLQAQRRPGGPPTPDPPSPPPGDAR
jgi:hypothetical protein